MRTRIKLKTKKHFMEVDIPKYLGQIQFHGAKRLAVGESRWYWIPSMLILLICASALIYLTVERFQDNPTFMTQNDQYNTIMKFPSVVICPEIDFQNVKIKEFLSNVNYPDSLNKTYIEDKISQLASFYAPDMKFEVEDLLNLENFLKYNNMDVEAVSKQLTRTCEDTLIKCRWNNKYYNCSDLFEMEITGDGFCCVFNGRSLRRQLRESFHSNIFNKNQDWNTRSVGFRSGLILAINQSQQPRDINLSYKWIVVQGAQRFVDPSLNGTPLNPGSEQWMIYQMRSFYISDAAKKLSPALRRCILSEQALKYFPEYKRKYCILECEIENTLKLCNCLRFVHPNPNPLHLRYCGAIDHECASHSMVAYGHSCECMSTCNLDSNLITTSSFRLDSSVVPIDPFYANLSYENVSIVRVFIQSPIQRTFYRTPYFSYMELFSQLGGMFNVFFGVSILTILGIAQFVWTISVSFGRKVFDTYQVKL